MSRRIHRTPILPVSGSSQTIDFFGLGGNAVIDMARPDHTRSWIIADVGATSSRCALLCPPTFEVSAVRRYRNDDVGSLQEVLTDYLVETDSNPTNCALAVAAPVNGNDVRMINRDWQFNRHEISRRLGVEQTDVINDFHAIGYALPGLDDSQRTEVGKATEYRRGNIAVLGPGSGLGMSAWIDKDPGGAVMCGEGGHITVSGRCDNEDAIVAKLRDRFGHCSAERVLSGPGIIALHNAMHDIDVPSSEEITAHADDPLCQATMNQFFRFLGSAAADLALITGAAGGVYIAGGIVPACIDQIKKSEFRTRFEDKNRYGDYMRAMPTWVITDPTPGLTGLSAFVRQWS
jgi:glucokinase